MQYSETTKDQDMSFDDSTSQQDRAFCKLRRNSRVFNLLDANKIMGEKVKSKIERYTGDERHWIECSDKITDKILLGRKNKSKKKSLKQKSSKKYVFKTFSIDFDGELSSCSDEIAYDDQIKALPASKMLC